MGVYVGRMAEGLGRMKEEEHKRGGLDLPLLKIKLQELLMRW